MKKILITSGILLHFIGGMAAPRSIQQAQQIAESFAGSAISFYNGPSLAKARLAKSEDTPSATPYYIFNLKDSADETKDRGFVIISSDDDFRDILGYCPNGSYQEDDLPDGFKYWLETLEEEMSVAKANKLKKSEEEQDVSGQPSIEPLIKTYWAQGEPYNNMIPIGSTNHSNGKAATGCVATAMAQVMRYWEWPSGNATGRCYNTNYDISLTFTYFAFTRYNWDLMLSAYGDYTSAGKSSLDEKQEYTEEQAKAVAELMYHCGVTTNMKWGNSSSTGNTIAMKALMTYYRYNKYMHAVGRDVCSPREYRDILLNELNHGRPMLYWGKNTNGGGHYFICDGFDTNTGMFHFNWGWAGLYDGYYALSAVNGEQLAYNYFQFACVGCQPETEGEYTPVITASTMTLGEVKYGYNLDITFTNFTNSSVDFEGEIGVALLQDGEIKYSNYESALGELSSNEFYPSYTLKSFRLNSSIEKGEYILCAIARNTDGTFNIIKANYGTPYMWKLVIDSSKSSVSLSPIIVKDDIADAIKSTESNPRQIISTEYFTLSGTKVSRPIEGIYVQRTNFSDGTSKSIKIRKAP